MKNLFKTLSAAALLFAGATVYAQDPSNTNMSPSFGVKGGVNFATVTGDDFDSPDSRTSFHVGLLAEFPLAEIFSLQVEALYSGQGFKSDVNGGIFGGEGKVEYQLDYINVPVLAKVYLIEGLSIEAGPQFSFKVNEEIDADANADGGDLDVNEAEDFEFGVAAGLTFQTKMGLFATGRYNLGITDVVKDQDIKNSVFQIGIGYKF
ncbi:porin family protein [Flavobacterium sp. DG1-102-2]|uniref:porin family protein n=1 Tax=Flavobacterium sp. DG1-102-2 TaxID=3081663 RepID=UPI002949451D|nr:porin family protein [Flavobacterium sp. DG1-102-2]MDV6167957.1 porin family protein [Flavobacterium sp. DG1-102-2]